MELNMAKANGLGSGTNSVCRTVNKKPNRTDPGWQGTSNGKRLVKGDGPRAFSIENKADGVCTKATGLNGLVGPG
jgi:hypothetical protein